MKFFEVEQNPRAAPTLITNTKIKLPWPLSACVQGRNEPIAVKDTQLLPKLNNQFRKMFLMSYDMHYCENKHVIEETYNTFHLTTTARPLRGYFIFHQINDFCCNQIKNEFN